MAKINTNYLKLPGSYLFVETKKRVAEFKEKHPNADIISLGIGDVTQPLAPAVVKAMRQAVDEMSKAATFRGYGPEQGYDFLLKAIVKGDYLARGIKISEEEVFVGDGAKCDVGNIQEIFDKGCTVAVPDPVYPVYLDTNVMAGRTGKLKKNGYFKGIVYLKGMAENNFCPEPPSEKADLIYLCSPNNPTGAAFNKKQLKRWVEYARKNESVIIYDSAYESYITEPDIPHSIYEIPGAQESAIEIRSFSKTAGFTGVRCGYTVVPQKLAVRAAGAKIKLNGLWSRRQSTKFNGVSYITQRGAEAVYGGEGSAQIKQIIDYYMGNAQVICSGFAKLDLNMYGGVNAPYIWLKTPKGMSSWEMFDYLLAKAHVVGTPGVGFGPAGDGYFRLTAFGDAERTKEAIERIGKIF
ncbi:MAG: LL-diaminopimelate aminotransferase [Acidaminococcales bacterium]|jgi:LL-diaminopimelate aminotransferase|nr:LL-diaminopimelate aminotransferase [Acidaminococcales bacterium]